MTKAEKERIEQLEAHVDYALDVIEALQGALTAVFKGLLDLQGNGVDDFCLLAFMESLHMPSEEIQRVLDYFKARDSFDAVAVKEGHC